MHKKVRLIDKLLFNITALLRCRVIRGNHGEPYLERYHLFRLPGGGGAYIHRFLSSDPGRGLHDHPWDRALGVVLAGGYREQRLVDNQVVERDLVAGCVNRLRGADFHRIILPAQRQAWTLFMHSRKAGDWGFLTLRADGARDFMAHDQVNHEGRHHNWWKYAPRGRNAAREPLQRRQQLQREESDGASAID
jgi:hypothetical protein